MKFNRSLAMVFLILLISGRFVAAEDKVQLPEKENFHLFLLVGQSNMAGRGEVSAEDRVANPRVLALTKDKQWKCAVDPIHFDKSVAGVGLGRTFGIVIAEATPGVTVGLIPCAVGGSPISTWQPGAYYEQTKSHPYDDSIERAKAAMNVGTLKGILWHQGESDSNEEFSEVYEQKLEELIARFRSELEHPTFRSSLDRWDSSASDLGARRSSELTWRTDRCQRKWPTPLSSARMVWTTKGTRYTSTLRPTGNSDVDTPVPLRSLPARSRTPQPPSACGIVHDESSAMPGSQAAPDVFRAGASRPKRITSPVSCGCPRSLAPCCEGAFASNLHSSISLSPGAAPEHPRAVSCPCRSSVPGSLGLLRVRRWTSEHVLEGRKGGTKRVPIPSQ